MLSKCLIPIDPGSANQPYIYVKESNNDILEHLMNLRDGSNPSAMISPEEVAERCMTVIFASMVTTAGAMVHVIHDIAGRGQMPVTVARPGTDETHSTTLWDALYDEQQYALKICEGVVSVRMMEYLPLLTSFIKESMRMSSLSIQSVRYAVSDGNFGGFALDSGTMVGMSGSLSSFNPDVYPHPYDFIPTRFIKNTDSDPASSSEFGLFPFGIGKHVCVGRYFAYAELHIVAMTLMQRYKFNTVDGGVSKCVWEPAGCHRVEKETVFIKTQ